MPFKSWGSLLAVEFVNVAVKVPDSPSSQADMCEVAVAPVRLLHGLVLCMCMWSLQGPGSYDRASPRRGPLCNAACLCPF